ncbi:hypothetical protein [Paenibacillus pedocola]|nr:hypothetical protein [Paenibacillus typhae]
MTDKAMQRQLKHSADERDHSCSSYIIQAKLFAFTIDLRMTRPYDDK